MDLKQNKGFVGIDISISVLSLIILIPTIMGIVYNINKSNNSAKIKSEALNIAINAVETAKGMEIKNVTVSNLLTEFLNKNTQYTVTTDSTNNVDIVATDTGSYKLSYDVEDYNEHETTATANIVKTVKATVKYKIGNEEKSIDLSTVIE